MQTPSDEVLTVTPTDMDFSWHEGRKQFLVQSKYRMPWQIDSTFSAQWVHIKDSANKMYIEVDENLSGMERTSIVEIVTADHKYKKVISVSQATLDAASLEVSVDTITLYTNAQAVGFTITADGEWHIDNLPDWVQINRTDTIEQQISLEAIQTSFNAQRDTRSQLVSLVYRKKKKDLLIRQWGNVEAHINSGAGMLQSILTENNLLETIETLTLNGVMEYSDFEWIHLIKKLRVLDLSAIELSDGRIDLPAFALKDCAILDRVVVPSAIKTISKGLFMDSPKLRQINIPDSVAVIEEMAFSGCQNLGSLALPKMLTMIEAGAFGRCSLKNLTLNCDTPPALGELVFDAEAFDICIVSVPKGSLEQYKADEVWGQFKQLVEHD